MRYVIIGAGAVGGTVGGRLAQAGREVVLVARGRHLAALAERGLRLRVPEGESTYRLPAMAAVARAEFTGLALLDGRFGLVMAPYGRPRVVLAFAFDDDGRITRIEAVAEPDRLREIEIIAPGEPEVDHWRGIGLGRESAPLAD